MSRETWDIVDRYINDTLVGSDPVLEAAVQSCVEAGLPEIAVTPNQGKLLHLLALATGARRVLEIGTLGGYSAIWLGRALPPDGRLVTLEADPKHAEIARANLDRAGLTETVEIRLGAALDTLPQLAAEGEGEFDLVFIDADKANIPDYVTWALRLSHPGSLLVIDNVVRDGKVADEFSDDADVQGVRRANDLLAADPRVSATALQTVGLKGYDGLAIALVTDGA
jgi:predicted O-methyltransferase YrrM